MNTAHSIHLPTPLQLVKLCYGVRNHNQPLAFVTFCKDDPQLMNLDAPDLLPAGSMRRSDYAGWADIEIYRESYCFRPDIYRLRAIS